MRELARFIGFGAWAKAEAYMLYQKARTRGYIFAIVPLYRVTLTRPSPYHSGMTYLSNDLIADIMAENVYYGAATRRVGYVVLVGLL